MSAETEKATRELKRKKEKAETEKAKTAQAITDRREKEGDRERMWRGSRN